MSLSSFITLSNCNKCLASYLCSGLFLWLASHFLSDQPGSSSADNNDVHERSSQITYCSLLCAPAVDPSPWWDHHIMFSRELMYLFFPMHCELLKGRSHLSSLRESPEPTQDQGCGRYPRVYLLILLLIHCGCSCCLIRFLAFRVRSGLFRNFVQKAIWCASQSGSPAGSLVWMWRDNHRVQRPRLGSWAQKRPLSHAGPELVQGETPACSVFCRCQLLFLNSQP